MSLRVPVILERLQVSLRDRNQEVVSDDHLVQVAVVKDSRGSCPTPILVFDLDTAQSTGCGGKVWHCHIASDVFRIVQSVPNDGSSRPAVAVLGTVAALSFDSRLRGHCVQDGFIFGPDLNLTAGATHFERRI